MLPGILTQLGSEGLSHLKRLANNVVGSKILSSVQEEGKEEDIPDLVENFENVANSEAQEKKVEEKVQEAPKPSPTPAAPAPAEEKKETKKDTTPKKSANDNKGGKKQQSKDKKA